MADDHPMILQGLKSVFSKEPHIIVAGTFTTGTDLLHFLSTSHVNVVLLDISLPDIHGTALCRNIKQQWPATCVIAFSNHNERPIIMQMLQNGASGYLLKNIPPAEFLQCIDEALQGQITFCTETRKIMANPGPSDLKNIPPLTRREKQMLLLIADGKTNPLIAEQLSLSILTIETHRKNLMQKLKAGNVAELIKTAAAHHLL